MITKKKYILSTLLLLFLDFAWLKFYMNKQYQKQVLTIQGEKMKINKYSAILSYILMVIGLNLFVLPNIRPSHALMDSLKYGFLFGIILYGVYDFTCGAVFKKWNMKLAVIDMLWGGFVYFIVALISSKL